MKKLLTFMIIALFSVSAFAQTNWKADPMHSKINFSVTHSGISDIEGLFNSFEAQITSAKSDFSDASITLSIAVKSIDTEIKMRDDHLRSADFFDVEKYPTITFKSNSIKKTDTDQYQITGDLNLHGITKSVTMNLWYRGTIEQAKTKTKVAGFQLTGTIKRSDFKVGPEGPFISDEVAIKADGEFIQQP